MNRVQAVNLSRRRLIQGAAAGVALSSWTVCSPCLRAQDHTQNTVLPFSRGDVLVGCTLLNDPNDDHKGRGRILHYDAALGLRQTLWLDDTTHIVQGLRFAPDGKLWAFDAFAHQVAWFGPDGRRVASPDFPSRSFAHVNFAADGRYFLGENFVGERSRVPLKTTLPFVPGSRRFGEGHLYEFSARHQLVGVHTTPVHGGMGGFQGLTSSVLTPDEDILVYTSESGPRIMRWHLREQRALADLVQHTDNSGKMFFEIRLAADGTLLVLTGLTIERYAMDGRLLRVYPLGSFGWASMSHPREDRVYLSNFFSGELAGVDLIDGKIFARTQTGIRKSASGLDQCADDYSVA